MEIFIPMRCSVLLATVIEEWSLVKGQLINNMYILFYICTFDTHVPTSELRHAAASKTSSTGWTAHWTHRFRTSSVFSSDKLITVTKIFRTISNAAGMMRFYYYSFWYSYLMKGVHFQNSNRSHFSPTFKTRSLFQYSYIYFQSTQLHVM